MPPDAAPADARPPEARPPAAPAGPRPGRRWVVVGTVLAWIALAAFVVALVLAVVPVSNHRPVVDQAATDALRKATGNASAYVLHDGSATLQDCGAPVVFVATGRLQNHYGGGKSALERARESYANAHSCSDRVAGRLVPAGLLLVGGLVLSGVAFGCTMKGRSKARAAWAAANPAPEPPADPFVPPGGLPSPG